VAASEFIGGNPLHSRFVHLLAIVPLILPTAGHAAAKAQAFSEPMPATAQQLPRQAKPHTAIIAKFDDASLSADQIELLFADGHLATAEVRRVTNDAAGTVQSWTGEFTDEPGSVLALTRTRGVVAGFANRGGRSFELLPSRDGRHVFFEVDGERLPRGDEFESNHREARRGLVDLTAGSDAMNASTATADAVAGTTATTSGSVTVHDVLIYYTAASASKWGQATVESMIRSAVQAANLAYQSSLARVSLNVVGLQRSPVAESSSMSATVIALKNNATAQAARDNLGADMVLVVNENSDVCGYAQLWYSWSGSWTNWDAYAGTASGCLSTQTLAHEIAHMQQLDHNKESAAGFAPYPYSYGYRVCTSGGFRDIMSYPCSMTVARINYFSNPNLTWNGYAIGNSQSADGARHLNETASIVAAYRPTRTSTVTPGAAPAAPTNVAAANGGNGTAIVTWADKSSNETKFEIYRAKWDWASGKWLARVSVGSVGADVTRFVNSTGKGKYRFYVRAVNSYGASTFAVSQAVRVTGG
jgi:hypothetical protein